MILGLGQLTYFSDPPDDGFSVLERALQAWGPDEMCQNALPEPTEVQKLQVINRLCQTNTGYSG